MAKREAVTLNEDLSKLQVPQSGDSYTLPRNVEIGGELTLDNGVINSNVADVPGASGFTLNAPVMNEITGYALRVNEGSENILELSGNILLGGTPLGGILRHSSQTDYTIFGMPTTGLVSTEVLMGAVEGLLGYYILQNDVILGGIIGLDTSAEPGGSVNFMAYAPSEVFTISSGFSPAATDPTYLDIGNNGAAPLESYIRSTPASTHTLGGAQSRDGSNLNIEGGAAYDSGAVDRDGGKLILSGGAPANNGDGGGIDIFSGDGGLNADAADIRLRPGLGGGIGYESSVRILAPTTEDTRIKLSAPAGNSGAITIYDFSGQQNLIINASSIRKEIVPTSTESFSIIGQDASPSAPGMGGNVSIRAGHGANSVGDADGGNLSLSAGDGVGFDGTDGNIEIGSQMLFDDVYMKRESGRTLSTHALTSEASLKVYGYYDPSLTFNNRGIDIGGNGEINSFNQSLLIRPGLAAAMNGWDVSIYGGGTTGGTGGNVNIGAAPGFAAGGGDLTMSAGDGASFGGNFNGGNVTISAGTQGGNGAGGDVTISAGGVGGNSDGVVRVETVFHVEDGVTFKEQSATTGTVNTGEMRLWARDDTPNSLILVNDEGTETVLGDSTSQSSIVDYVTYTVGAEQDFETLMDAISWAQEQTFSGGGHLELQLLSGTHVIAPVVGEESRYEWSYSIGAFTNAAITIAGTGAANTTIAWDSTDPDTDGYDLMTFINSFVIFKWVTLDTYGDGFTDYEKYINADSSYIFFNDCVVKNTYLYIASESDVLFRSGELDASNLSLYGNSTARAIISMEFKNMASNEALTVTHGSTFVSTVGITFTNNTTDTNIPLNVIQTDQSFISDGNLELRNSIPLSSTTLASLSAGNVSSVPNNSFYMDDSNVLWWKDNTGASKSVNLT